MPSTATTSTTSHAQDSSFSIFCVFLKLGCIAFGGPIAHLAYFRQSFVVDRHWISESAYAELVSLCQFLPGPASSQLGMALGYLRGGFTGSVAAWLGFTLPSALLLLTAAFGLANLEYMLPTGVIQGLKLAALAIVVQAFWGMATQLCPDKTRLGIMVTSAVLLTLLSSHFSQILVIALAGLVGIVLIKPNQHRLTDNPAFRLQKIRQSTLCVALFLCILIITFAAELTTGSASEKPSLLTVFNVFYQTGSLVFGGGHVVLPLLESTIAGEALLTQDRFLAGYGLAQAVPGPLFTVATFMGAFLTPNDSPQITPALIATFAIFLPGYLLIIGLLPLWKKIREYFKVQAALAGANAAVVGLLLAALYNPIWTSCIHQPRDFGFALAAWWLLHSFKCAPWLCVLLAATLYPILMMIAS